MRIAAAILAVSLACGITAACRAGGGPENLFLVVNPANADSLAVANTFATLRQVPPINVFMLPWTGDQDSVPIGTFRDAILAPILRAIDARRLSTQIDCVVYSSGFPWRVDYADELSADLKAQDRFPAGSLTGMTMLHAAGLRQAARRGGALVRRPHRRASVSRISCRGTTMSTMP